MGIVYTASSAGWASNIEIRTPSKELFEEILKNYQGRIFPENIRGTYEYNADGLALSSSYVVNELSLSLLEGILEETEGDYEICINYNGIKHLIIGREGEKIWLSE